MSSVGMMKKVRVVFTEQRAKIHGWVQSLVTPKYCQIFNYLVSTHDCIVTGRDYWVFYKTKPQREPKNKKKTLFSTLVSSYLSDSEMTHPNPLAFSFFAADFITGVPKGLMLYGVVRSPSTVFSFCSNRLQNKKHTHTLDTPRPWPLVKKAQYTFVTFVWTTFYHQLWLLSVSS